MTVYRAECCAEADRPRSRSSADRTLATLIADLGYAYCEELEVRRSPLRLEDAKDGGSSVATRDALAFLPERRLAASEARAVSLAGGSRRVRGDGPCDSGRMA